MKNTETTLFAPANNRGITLKPQAALDLVYLRLITQRHSLPAPPIGTCNGVRSCDYSQLFTKFNAPYAIIQRHWFGPNLPLLSDHTRMSYREGPSPNPTAFSIIRDCLGLDFLFALNDAYLETWEKDHGSRAALAANLKAVALAFGLEVPTDDTVLYMRSRRPYSEPVSAGTLMDNL